MRWGPVRARVVVQVHTGTRFRANQGDPKTPSSRKPTPSWAPRLPWGTRQGQPRNNPRPPGPEEPSEPSTEKGRDTQTSTGRN